MKQTISLFIAFILSFTFSFAQKNAVYEEYIQTYKDIAIEQMLKYKIPASITLAQGLFESGAGRSELTVKGNNHFGIKCHNSWTGPRVYHDDDAKGECFRAYNSARESYEDHSLFLANSQRYSKLFSLSTTDYKGWARGLKECGYATSPVYADKLINIIELYNLQQYDTRTSYTISKPRTTETSEVFTQGIAEAIRSSIKAKYPMSINNDVYFVCAKGGESYKDIATAMATTATALANYNELDKNHICTKGEVVYIEKKKKKAAKEYKNKVYVVKAGDSMHSIAQRFAIRLKNLYLINALSPEYQIKIGDRLFLR